MPKKITINENDLDDEIKGFRIEAAQKALFQSKCKEAGLTMTKVLRGLIRAVNGGEILIDTDLKKGGL